MNVTIWNEFRHEKNSEAVRGHYPRGIHGAIAAILEPDADLSLRTATLDDPSHGISSEVLASTDVLVWWGHLSHNEISDEVTKNVVKRVHAGMGFIALHSAHYSKPFKALMGTSCSLNWRLAADREQLWTVNPKHPIAIGLPPSFDLSSEEMYGEPFEIPEPEELVFISWFSGGEVFRSGACWTRGRGKIFYFRPGHETFPTYHNPYVAKVIQNAVRWVGRRSGWRPR